LKIRKKLTLFVVFSSLFASIAVVLLAYLVGSNFLVQRTQHAFQIETYFTLRELDRLFFERSADLEVMGRALTPLVAAQKYAELENLLFTLRDYIKAFQNFAFVDAQNIKQVDTNRIGIGEKVDWPILQKAKIDSKVVFEFHTEADSRSEVISFVKKIESEQGVLLGYIICNVPFTAISRITRLSKENSLFKVRNRVELLRDTGEIVYSTFRLDKIDKDLAGRIKNSLQDNSEFKFLKSKNKLWSFGRGHNYYTRDSLNWFLVMSAKQSDVYSPLKSALLILIGLLLVVGIIFWLVISNISKAIVRPLESATSAVSEFGFGNLKALDVLETPDDDLGVLIKSLKKMGNQIQNLMTQRAQKARVSVLGEMAGNIAHEINNPLQVISIRLDLIQRALKQGYAPEVLESNIDIASQTLFRISKIVKGLKALSREGDADPFAAVTIQELIDNVLVLCQGSLTNSMVQIEFNSSQPLFKIECRAVQITQVLLNLINNAHDAVKECSERWIKIHVEVSGNEVFFKVRNSGPKISDELAKKIFDPFFTTKSHGQGTGLGLSISQKIAKKHSGSLFVDTNDPQTCFVLKILTRPLGINFVERNRFY
jgi:C4-dicarboxylate-specific signal transduction histidine kinase